MYSVYAIHTDVLTTVLGLVNGGRHNKSLSEIFNIWIGNYH